MVHPSTAATALMAVGAKIELVKRRAAKREPFADFYLGRTATSIRETDPGRVRCSPLLGCPQLRNWPRVRSSSSKVRSLRSTGRSPTWRCCSIANEGLCSLGHRSFSAAAAPVPHRARAAEAALRGKPVQDQTARGCCACGARGRRTAIKECLRAADFRDARAARAILAAAAA